MASSSSLLAICPNGAWVTENTAARVLGLGSKDAVREKFRTGLLPHVFAEHGKRVGAPAPFSEHHFLYIQREGTSAASPSLGLAQWVALCLALESSQFGSATEVVKQYTNRTDAQEAYGALKAAGAVASSAELAGAGVSSGYNYGYAGAKNVSAEGEIYVRADGKKVRRVKRASSATNAGTSLAGFLSGGDGAASKGESKLGQMKASQSVAAEGEIYVRADGKKVRRVRKTAASVSSEGPDKKSLSGFLDKGGSAKPSVGGSASVAGDQLAVSKDASLTGEVYVRADGKKVRRVKKSVASDENVEIITRPDGTKVRRIRRTKPAATSGELSGFLDNAQGGQPAGGVGSQSVGGDQHLEGEIYVRPDGTKVRRVKKAKPQGGEWKDATTFASQGGQDVEIITRADGTKVRRIRKTAGATSSGTDQKGSLGGFLEKSGGNKPMVGGSASVAGDQLAVSKDASLTGEVYVRADGKKVRRVKKAVTPQAGDNVEIITRPDGTKVRRIRRTKPKAENTGDLNSFLGSQPNAAPAGGAATVSGGMAASAQAGNAATPQSNPASADGNKKSLDGFLGQMDPGPRKVGGSASVAGDQLAVSKDSSLTGEVYVRADGKKVRRVRKPTATQPGDQVEIITRPDGTKVRRIRRAAKKPAEANAANGEAGQLDGFLSSATPTAKTAASVTGDMLHSADAEGEIYIRADGKKVRRIRKPAQSSAASNDQYEIYTRPDGKKVRRIKKSALAAQQAQAAAPAAEPAPSPAAPPAPSGASSAEEDIASGYRKMLRMGMPEGAVAQKMAVDGVPQNIQDSVLAGGAAAPPAPAPAPRPVPPPAPAPTPAAPQTSRLSPEEEEIAGQYRKMLKMGMPDGAVAQKMAVDGIPQNIVDSVLAREIPAPAAPTPAPAPVSAASSALSPEEEEIAAQYRKMLKMGMPEGAVAQKMAVDGVPQNIQDSVFSGGASAPAPASTASSAPRQNIPAGMALVPKDQATVPEGMVLVPKEQAERTIPEGMVAVPKDKAAAGVPDGFVLVPKDKVKGDPGDDLVLVKQDQVKGDGTVVVMMSPNQQNLKKESDMQEDQFDIEGANIVSMDDLDSKMNELTKGGDGKKPRFLLQALPSDRDLEKDFIKKNLLPKDAAASEPEPARPPAPAPPPAQSSTTIADILAQMSTLGGDFDAEKMGDLLQKLEDSEKRQKKLEKQLAAAGVKIAEDIDYDTCIKKIAQIGKRMGEIGGSDVTHPDKEEQNRLREEYFKLEQEMEKYNNALLLTDEYQAEQDRLEKKWELDNAPGNLEALKKLRRHMPVEVRNMSEAQLTNNPSPNGKYLPKAIAKKFKRTNVLQIIRRNPDDIQRMHPSTLENMRVTGLTLTERRAIYEHVRSIGPQWKAMKAEKMTEKKWVWYNMMKNNFKESLASYNRHIAQYGPPGNHPYATRDDPNAGCPLIGKQCPLRADKLVDYDKEDYGWTDGAEYEVSEVRKADTDDPGAKAMQEALELMKEKKANERGDALKKHYKGKLLQVSKANGSCEQMDEMMDKMEYGMMKWLEDILRAGDDKTKVTDDVKKKELAGFTDVLNDCKLATLDICGRSGMQTSGKKGGDEKPDPRSVIECSLAEELSEAFEEFAKFVAHRLKENGIIDTRVKSTIDMLKSLLGELRGRNSKTMSNLGSERLSRSRPLKTRESMEKEIKEKMAAQAPAEEESGGGGGGGGPPAGMPGPPRGGLMDAIKGGRGGGGRGGLMDAIQGRGRGGGRGGGGGGRGGLMAAIQGRGAGKGRGGGGGGRGGLMAAIQGRGAGRGGGGGGGGGGRGGLLAAIQGRGRG